MSWFFIQWNVTKKSLKVCVQNHLRKKIHISHCNLNLLVTPRSMWTSYHLGNLSTIPPGSAWWEWARFEVTVNLTFDLWSPKSHQIISESKWMLVPNLTNERWWCDCSMCYVSRRDAAVTKSEHRRSDFRLVHIQLGHTCIWTGVQAWWVMHLIYPFVIRPRHTGHWITASLNLITIM